MNQDYMLSYAKAYFLRYQYYDKSENIGSAILTFQRDFGLPETGVLDDFTLSKIREPRCGNCEHGKMSAMGPGDAWPGSDLNYIILNATPDLGFFNVALDLADAFEIWERVTSLKFTRVTNAANAHFKISFASLAHGDGFPFDGAGGTLAHAFYPPPNSRPGHIHFDEAENWTRTLPVPNGGVDFMTVAIHEIGHALGLTHSSDPSSAMYPSYKGVFRALGQDDIKRIQSLYPNCPPPPPAPVPPYNDPTVKMYLDHWVQTVNRCYKKLEPRAYIDKWGRACGRHAHYTVKCAHKPDPQHWTSYQYLWYHNRKVRNYPHSVRTYVSLRSSGKSYGELNYCG